MKKFGLFITWRFIVGLLTVCIVLLLVPESEALRGSAVVLHAKLKPADQKQNNEEDVSGDNSTTVTGTKSPLTGIPQLDYLLDPNLPRELNGYNLTDYPFYNAVPTDIDFKCDGLHDGFYASVPHKCQVYHHCLYGTRYDFLCANYTAFDQKTFICHFVSEVDCNNSPKYFKRNEALYKAVSSSTTSTTTTTSTTSAPAAPPAAYSGGDATVRLGEKRRRPARRRRPIYEYYYDDDEYADVDYYDEPAHRQQPNRKQSKFQNTESDNLDQLVNSNSDLNREQVKPLVRSSSGSNGAAASVYDRPRVAPKIHRPVPKNEREKYDYGSPANKQQQPPQQQAATSAPSSSASGTEKKSTDRNKAAKVARPATGTEDEYYDTEEEQRDYDYAAEMRNNGYRNTKPHPMPDYDFPTGFGESRRHAAAAGKHGNGRKRTEIVQYDDEYEVDGRPPAPPPMRYNRRKVDGLNGRYNGNNDRPYRNRRPTAVAASSHRLKYDGKRQHKNPYQRQRTQQQQYERAPPPATHDDQPEGEEEDYYYDENDEAAAVKPSTASAAKNRRPQPPTNGYSKPRYTKPTGGVNKLDAEYDNNKREPEREENVKPSRGRSGKFNEPDFESERKPASSSTNALVQSDYFDSSDEQQSTAKSLTTSGKSRTPAGTKADSNNNNNYRTISSSTTSAPPPTASTATTEDEPQTVETTTVTAQTLTTGYVKIYKPKLYATSSDFGSGKSEKSLTRSSSTSAMTQPPKKISPLYISVQAKPLVTEYPVVVPPDRSKQFHYDNSAFVSNNNNNNGALISSTTNVPSVRKPNNNNNNSNNNIELNNFFRSESQQVPTVQQKNRYSNSNFLKTIEESSALAATTGAIALPPARQPAAGPVEGRLFGGSNSAGNSYKIDRIPQFPANAPINYDITAPGPSALASETESAATFKLVPQQQPQLQYNPAAAGVGYLTAEEQYDDNYASNSARAFQQQQSILPITNAYHRSLFAAAPIIEQRTPTRKLQRQSQFPLQYT